jgi:hypothetical protein
MSITLDELVTRLQEDVLAVDGIPTEESYIRMVKEAVRDFSRRCGRVRRAILNIVSGTATYDLATDFLKLINLVSLTAHDGIINSPQGLIPVPLGFCEDYTIDNGQITFYPTPTYTLAREYRYKAGWILTNDVYDTYETMGEEEADIVLMKASASALDSLWRNSAGQGFRYQIGDEMVDKSGIGDDHKRRSDKAESGYVTACEQYNGNTSRML